jgi:hypothetical protein
MGGGSVLWAETPENDGDETETEAHGAVDESFAVRRLRRWLRGMFGGTSEPTDESPEREPEA